MAAPDGSLLVTNTYGSASTATTPSALYAFSDLDGTVATLATIGETSDTNSPLYPIVWTVQHRTYGSFGTRTGTYGAVDATDPTKVFTEAADVWHGYGRDADTGLARIGNRWFAPEMGRFLTQGAASLGSSPYTLDGNEPLADIDAPRHKMIGDNVNSPGYFYYLTHPWEMDTDLQIGFWTAGAVGIGAGGWAGGLGIAGASVSASGVVGATGATLNTISYASLAWSTGRYAFTGEGGVDVLLDAASLGLGPLARVSKGLLHTTFVTADIGIDLFQGLRSSGAAWSDFQRGDFLSGSLNLVGGFLGLAGAGLRARSLRQTMLTDPTTNPLNYSIHPRLASGLGFFGDFKGFLRYHAPNSGILRGGNKSRVVFDGMEVRGVRDLSHVSDSTLKQMAKDGFAAKDINGKSLQLHHLDQNPAGPVVEIPGFRHKISNEIQHPFGNAPGAGLTAEQRAAFDAWRVNYWKARAAEELAQRGISP